jgi:hypothetical protein
MSFTDPGTDPNPPWTAFGTPTLNPTPPAPPDRAVGLAPLGPPQYQQSPNVPAPAPPAPTPPPAPPAAAPVPPPVPAPTAAPASPAAPAPAPAAPLPPQRYTPASTRPHKQWGAAPWAVLAAKHYPSIADSTFMPSPREAPHVIRGAAGQLAPWTPPQLSTQYNALQGIARLIGPVMDFYSGGAFGRGWDTANEKRLSFQREQFEMGRERMMDMSRNVIMQHKQMLMDYQQIFEEYEQGGLSKEQAEQEVADLANRNNDPGLVQLLHNGGLKGVNNFLSWQDAKLMDMWGSYASLANDRASKKGSKAGTAADPDEWLKSSAGLGGGGRPLPGGAMDEAETPETPVADTEDAETDTVEGTDYDKELEKNFPDLAGPGIKAAHDIVQNGEVPGMTKAEGRQLHPQAYHMAASAAGQINSAIDQVAANPRMSTPDKLQAIGKIDKTVPGIVSSLADYSTDPKDLPLAVRARFINLAQRVDPSYKPANFKDAHKFSDPNSTENKVNTRAADAMQSTINVLAQTNRTGDESQPIPKRELEKMIAGTITGDDAYAALYNALRVWGQNVNQVTSLTGNPRVTLVHDMLAHLGPTASPRTIRQQVMQEMQDVWSIAGNNQQQWERLGKRDLVPGLTPQVWRDYSAFLRMNPETGEMPSDASRELRNVSRDPSKASPRVKEDERWTPPTLQQVHTMQDWLRVNADKIASDPEYRRRADAFERALGTTINLPLEVPGE